MASKSQTSLDFWAYASLLLLPTGFLFHQFAKYHSFLWMDQQATALLVYFLLPIPIVLFLITNIGNDWKSLWHGHALLFVFFFYGAVQDVLLRAHVPVISKSYVTLTLLTGISLGASYLLSRSRNPKQPIYLLVFYVCAEMLVCGYTIAKTEPVKINKVELRQKAPSQHPDVYHFVFDGYTNSKILKAHFNYVNPLDSILKSRYFFVSNNARSNYNFTPNSVGSTLNMVYLPVKPTELERNFDNFYRGQAFFNKNNVFRFFEQNGYTVNYHSLLDGFEKLHELGGFTPRPPSWRIRNATLERIWLNPWTKHRLSLSKQLLPIEVRKNLRFYKKYNEDALQLALEPVSKPSYRFIHFFIPHEPYAYSKEKIDSLRESDLMDHSRGYVNQIALANSIILKMVTHIQEGRPAVIIIQGDHGFRNFPSGSKPELELETFSAFYFPNQFYSEISDQHSLVNTYRFVLNNLFEQKLPLLPNKFFLPVTLPQ